MKKLSRKHHYLPRNYLRGFTDSGGSFFVYDKLSGKIFRTSPDAAFFENDLNTVKFPDGRSSDFLERLYAKMESQSWHSLNNIRNSTPHMQIGLWDKMDLFFFLSFLHWRLPSNVAFAESLSQRFFGPEKELGFFNLKSTNDSTVPKEIIDKIRTSPVWKKAAKTIVPFAPFFKDVSWCTDLENWRFFYPTNGSNWFIVGDNPIVTRGYNDHDPITCLREFIFPVSGSILLISSYERLGGMLPAEFTIQYGTAIIHRARRFVACHDKSFLAALLKDHELHVRFGKTNRIIPELFKMLDSVESI